MNVYTDLNSLPSFPNAVITTGSFDGVHTGHVEILGQLIKEAADKNGTPVVITFYPHPKQVVQVKNKPLHILNTPAEKYELLQKNGIEHIAVVSFDTAFAELSAKEYIREFLVDKFHPAVIVVGYDHKFGRNRSGDFELLKASGDQLNFEVKEIPGHVMKDVTVSSTKIREALLAGDTKTAAIYLGYDYFFNGKVVEGNKLGRTLGYPTANLFIENELKLIPANGVYAVDLSLNDRPLKGMMNIGLRPTVDGTKRMIEVNIFDFDEDIYGQTLKVTLRVRLRDEVKFAGLEELKAQLAKDKEQALLVD